MTTLRLLGVGKGFGDVAALRDLSLEAAAGTRTAIVGPSGSGKTTLLRLIAGFETPDSGRIELDGVIVAEPRASVPAHRRNVGLVMQDGALFPHLSVEENIRFGMEGPERQSRRALELLDLVELDRGMAARKPHELSGGQQQRVALARALARRPGLMLLDEPFSALDTNLREQLRETTAGILAAFAITTLLVTHDQDEAMRFGDQLVVLRAGLLRQAGPPDVIYRAPADPETARFLGDAIILDALLDGGMARCCLGPVPVDSCRAGPAVIMLRPEQVTLGHAAADDHDAVSARLIAQETAGPVTTTTIEVASREFDTARLRLRSPAPTFPGGPRLTISVSGSAHVFAT